MSITIAAGQKMNVKQNTSADLLRNNSMPVINRAEFTSTAGQTIINLPFIVDQSSTENFWLFINGAKLRIGASNDFTFTSIDQANGSSQVTLTASLAEGLNIEAFKMGTKKETENLTDARFTQLYEGMNAGFQGFVDEGYSVPKLTAVNGAPGAGQFRTFGIVGRASIPDLANDLRARMGIDRIISQMPIELQNEFGSSGERVFSALNDDRGLIRYVGGGWGVLADTYGSRVRTNVQNDYIEVVFFGTGINFLTDQNGSPDIRYTVDGGSESGSSLTPASWSSVITGRNYNGNTILPIVSGLSLGVHTLKLRNNASSGTNVMFYGFEILNESSSLKVQPGVAYNQGKKIISSSQSVTAYNNNFESITREGASVGSLGARGARVLAYLKSDGSIGKAAYAVNSAQANLGSASHDYEEIVRTHHFREFGAGRSDDFSLTFSSASKAFTLDDGTTTLVASNYSTSLTTAGERITPAGAGSFVTITFVGTGLDIIMFSNTGSATNTTISVDGTSIGTFTGNVPNNIPTQLKIVSGLPYGTHTAKFVYNSGEGLGINKFIVYQPKKPTLPAGAVELADYNVMADFVANSTIGDYISTGVLTKSPFREMVYVGAGWATSFPVTTRRHGGQIGSTTSGDYFEYTFFGTGFDLRFTVASGRSADNTIRLNGTTLTAANFPTATFSTYGTGVAYNSATASLDMNDASTQEMCGFRVSGLPLGKYTFRATNNTSNNLNLDSFDIITPIHSPKSNFQADLQNTLPIGSCAISDNRRLSPVKSEDPKKAWAEATAVTADPTTTSTTFVPMPDMSLTFKSSGKPAVAIFHGNFDNSSSADRAIIALYVNGQAAQNAQAHVIGDAGTSTLPMGLQVMLNLSPGTHKIDMYWRTQSGNTLSAYNLFRHLTVFEIG